VLPKSKRLFTTFKLHNCFCYFTTLETAFRRDGTLTTRFWIRPVFHLDDKIGIAEYWDIGNMRDDKYLPEKLGVEHFRDDQIHNIGISKFILRLIEDERS